MKREIAYIKEPQKQRSEAQRGAVRNAAGKARASSVRRSGKAAETINIIASAALIIGLSSCSLSEEIKHIKASKEYEEQNDASRSSDLTGEQIFMRSCNTCHPGGKAGLGPSLADINEKYDDKALELLIRKGKGMMPQQPANIINDNELNHLVAYLRNLETK